MSPERLEEAAWFAAAVVITIIAVRIIWVLLCNRLAHSLARRRGDRDAASLSQGMLGGWCGMRGLVTRATAFAMPGNFPQRDLIVLTAFAVVLATLVVQGMTLAPLVRRLGLDGDDGLDEELAFARRELADAGVVALAEAKGDAADHGRWSFTLKHAEDPRQMEAKRSLGLAAIGHQRRKLEATRETERIGADAFLVLQEKLDITEVSLRTEEERRIEET